MAPVPVTPIAPGLCSTAASTTRTGASVVLFTMAESGTAMMSEVPARLPVDPEGATAVVIPGTPARVARTCGAA